VDLTCAFPPSPDVADHVALAEELGYRRAWLYDSPALYPDVWVHLARAAERTSTIGLGPGVLVPSLRHPVTNAAAVATLESLAPGRTAVAVGAGFTGRYVLGQKPMRWADVAAYVRCLRSLLRGEDVEWDGKVVRITSRPSTDVPVWIGADGPKGTAVADELGDGVLCAGIPNAAAARPGRPLGLLAFGTVLDPGEAPTSRRVRAAAGHAVAVALHAMYERGPATIDGVPGGREWREATEAVPAEVRHLAIHEGHLVHPNERDVIALEAGADALVEGFTLTGTAEVVRARLDGFATMGVTEVAYQPAGEDIARELRAFAAAATS
jgi:5,10-methylenetetrahydromethanopterin reductase